MHTTDKADSIIQLQLQIQLWHTETSNAIIAMATREQHLFFPAVHSNTTKNYILTVACTFINFNYTSLQ